MAYEILGLGLGFADVSSFYFREACWGGARAMQSQHSTAPENMPSCLVTNPHRVLTCTSLARLYDVIHAPTQVWDGVNGGTVFGLGQEY
jgi:hypothetical protein